MLIETREHVERICHILEGTSVLWEGVGVQELIAGLLSERLRYLRDQGVTKSRPNLWMLLPVFACEALSADVRRIEAAHHVGAAWELGSFAAGILDAWQDQDTECALWRRIGAHQAVNLAVGLIGLSFRTVSNLTETELLPAPIVVELTQAFADTLLRMVEGQHLDLSDNLDLADYQAVAVAKSGSLFRLACWCGAVVAGAKPGIATRYGAFGENLGLLIQAWNDLYGLEGASGKRDVGHKRTLPILAALAMAGEERTTDDPLVSSPEGQGGRIYTFVQVELLYQRSEKALARCPAAGRLARFLKQYATDRLLPGAEREAGSYMV